MHQYRVEGEIEYLKHCPRAPGVTNPCPSPSACPGHGYGTHIDLYVEAPDPERAEYVALSRIKSAYPWPVFVGTPSVVEVEQATTADRPDPASAPLPGFMDLLGRGGPHAQN